MPKTISIHSFLRGVGKSHIVANMASLLANAGRRVAVMDTNINAPSLQIIFGLGTREVKESLTDYLLGRCAVEQSVYDVTALLNTNRAGKLFVIPAEGESGESAQLLRQGYQLEQLGTGVHTLLTKLKLDALLIDTDAGLTQETMLSIALADALGVVLRLDKKDYQGTSLMLEIAKQLSVPNTMLIVNQTPNVYDLSEVERKVREAYNYEVAAILPHYDELASLGSDALFALRYPNHPLTARFQQMVDKLMSA